MQLIQLFNSIQVTPLKVTLLAWITLVSFVVSMQNDYDILKVFYYSSKIGYLASVAKLAQG